MQPLEQIREHLIAAIQEASDLATLEKVRVNALGKQGQISELMKTLGKLSPDERKEHGVVLNQLRDEISSALDARKTDLSEAELEARIAQEWVDVTLPARPDAVGTIHPLSQAMFEVIEIFRDMGFWVAEGPDIEDDFHNFSALNIPPEHPARQEQDTFYMAARKDGEKMILRTHTSPVQVRSMMSKKLPLRIIAPGRVYRSENDQTHTPTFHQVEGLFIDKGIHMGHLKGCIIEFCRRIFDVSDLPVRFRPGYFPFTEPSAEVDIGCSRQNGELKIGGGEDWLEILGCGMVHPNVLKNCGLDPEEHQGFAWGMGIERIAMLKYGISDLRAFYDADLRWLRHYGFSAFEGLMGGAAK